ncbi:MAG: CoB--CoM heterodisulfide reductase iron-sulfur subunit A family protein [Aigarchaeota archaeon]|nr:CoB--CoM heterodisulfide reductase iron-sulfur subunit A family protein [Aigarchaeota archaeon]MDH5702651.1 CoB--CoM heterodisulfide reductase iron-sulfur subunit A family protein [Aigarchaeota archaeon]
MEEPRIGVYVCHCGLNIAGSVDVKEVAEHAAHLPGVVVAREYRYVCSDPGQQMIRDDIEGERLNRVVVAACSPRMHEFTFRKTLQEAGLNPYLLEVANIREQCSWPHEREPELATEKAKALVTMAIAKARLVEPLQAKSVPVEKSTLVIGGGIAGISASLKLADQGFKVYLVEREPSIGGRMAQLDKTFPTLDCSACILTPMMVDVSRNPNIELLAYSDVKQVDGYVGNFKVTVRRKPRYLDEEKCTGCGTCATKCPAKAPNEFDLGSGTRKAIYVPFPQSVPLKYTIDPEHCLYFQKGICKVCEKFCEAGAIDFAQQPTDVEFSVGTIIVATGYDLFDPTLLREYGYGRFKNVITAMELERMSDASGPTHGKIQRRSDGETPRNVAFILCVGSREERKEGVQYCCRIGCTAALKEAFMLKNKLGDAVQVFICYTDLRAFGKGQEEFYRKVRDLGVRFIRGKPTEIHEEADGSLVFEVFDTATNMFLEVEADLLVLMTNLVPSRGTEELSRILKIPLGQDGFFMELHPKLRPAQTAIDGVHLAGTAQGPKDITDSVSHAGNAAAAAAALMARGEQTVEPIVASVNPDLCRGCGRCEEICEYGAIQVQEVQPFRWARVLAANVNEAVCRGCGACAVACPTGAISMRHYTDRQIQAMIKAAVEA